MFMRFLMVIFLAGLLGCSNKPGDADLAKHFNDSFAESFRQIGIDFSEYVEASSFKVTSSYEDGNFYVVKAIPKIKIKKDLDAGALQSFETKAGMMVVYVYPVIFMLENLKQFDAGQINEQQMMLRLRSAINLKPEGILKTGDLFSGLEGEYKFRRTDQGWQAVK